MKFFPQLHQGNQDVANQVAGFLDLEAAGSCLAMIRSSAKLGLAEADRAGAI
jgi:hypothetical protein